MHRQALSSLAFSLGIISLLNLLSTSSQTQSTALASSPLARYLTSQSERERGWEDRWTNDRNEAEVESGRLISESERERAEGLGGGGGGGRAIRGWYEGETGIRGQWKNKLLDWNKKNTFNVFKDRGQVTCPPDEHVLWFRWFLLNYQHSFIKYDLIRGHRDTSFIIKYYFKLYSVINE